MKYEVHNCGLNVGNIQIAGVSSSSVFLIGDNEHISLSSIFDTPPESLIVGPFVPLARKEKRTQEKTNHE
ncbi:spore gernimation protein GerPD [Pontibacillus sp. HMF3514]|uniref:spore gernimation protein GerPD n=1 Tax=Pontibacillus sp. HMF3514 TaxID=2692425 RepID=UPI00131FC7F3|nr:spore gernimation protein GerPD [Pontibacillus sp. HMF3514]QHE51385.1 spore gernimation protein GerPD [Pontibacillus sp. HMF3514]